jgi:hypothetical protein
MVVTLFECGRGPTPSALIHNVAALWSEQGTVVALADLDPNLELTRRCVSDRALDQWLTSSALSSAGGVRWLSQPHPTPLTRNLALVAGGAVSVESSSALRPWLESCAGGADATLVAAIGGTGDLARVALANSDRIVVVISDTPGALRGLVELQTWIDGEPAIAERLVGYVLEDAVWSDDDEPVHWTLRAERAYAEVVCRRAAIAGGNAALGRLRTYPSLEPTARTVRRPMVELGPADGLLDSQFRSVQQARLDLSVLADRIAAATWRPTAPAAAASAG